MEDAGTDFGLLLVDDDEAVAAALRQVFLKEGYTIHAAQDGASALGIMAEHPVDAAIVDLSMPGMDGLTLLGHIKRLHPETMVVILTGQGGINEAVEAMKLGAADFLEKPCPAQALRSKMAQLRQICALRRENLSLKARLGIIQGLGRLVGESEAMLRLKRLVGQVGLSEVSVLIQGETGTGKELVARAIHDLSPRADKPFVPVDCGAISEAVIESELFGHVRGAFTGAYSSTLGLIRSADGGTLFLDEVGELPPGVQVKLLRTIQTQEVRPLGSARSHPVDVRIIAATNRDLAGEVARGRFREDLYYRLNVITVAVPPLKERRGDIALLAKTFVQRFRSELSPVEGVTAEFIACLETHDWPGNVRELENVVRRALAMGQDRLLTPQDLPAELRSRPQGPAPIVPGVSGDSLADYEKAALKNALAKAHGNRRQAAAILGIGEATLYRKLIRYKLRPDPASD